MAVRYINKEAYRGCVRETFCFGAYRGKDEIKGTLYIYDDNTAKINLPYFKCLSFTDVNKARDFLSKNFSCKGDLVGAVVDREMGSRNQLAVSPICIGYFDSKYSFERERGIWLWDIKNIHTGITVGSIAKTRGLDGGYSLTIGKVGIVVARTRLKAEKLAKKILNEGVSFEDTIYAHEWKNTMKMVEEYWIW